MVVEKASKIRRMQRYRRLQKSEWYFKLWRVITTSFIYVILFWFLVMQMSTGIMEYVMTLVTTIVSMILGTITAKMITKSEFKEDKDIQFFIRAGIIILLYSTFTWLMYHFRVFELFSFWLLWVFFILAKAFVFLLADFVADRMSFGG